nr:PHP domain-containing protein [Gulosibacter bifidus]
MYPHQRKAHVLHNEHGIDLHTHSNASDGTESPADVVRAAAASGLHTIALTDHDTVSGWDAASRAALECDITLLPGIEVSSKFGGASVHVLAYLPDPSHPALNESMARVRYDRIHRAERIVAAIGADYELTWADVQAVSEPGATIGRPHIADALISLGIVGDRGEAFAGILHHRSKYYVPHESPSPADVVSQIVAAGGVPVLAHGGSRGAALLTEAPFAALVEAGLAGVEVGHRENDAAAQQTLLGYAERYDLIVTGSSDYHGDGKPNRLGEHTTAPDQLARIIEQAAGTAPVNLR